MFNQSFDCVRKNKQLSKLSEILDFDAEPRWDFAPLPWYSSYLWPDSTSQEHILNLTIILEGNKEHHIWTDKQKEFSE